MKTEPIVFIVDDDRAVRNGVSLLVRSFGMQVKSFATAEDFLAACDPSVPGCLVLDIRMPGMSGLQLHKELTDRQIDIPVIFLTGHGDVTSAVEAMKNGAVDYLQKPVDDRRFLDRIRSALAEDARRRKDKRQYEAIAARLALLTPRERQVLRGVSAGKPSKTIAYEFGISRKTVDVHRSRIMEKMNVRSVAELVTLLGKMESAHPPGH